MTHFGRNSRGRSKLEPGDGIGEDEDIKQGSGGKEGMGEGKEGRREVSALSACATRWHMMRGKFFDAYDSSSISEGNDYAARLLL